MRLQPELSFLPVLLTKYLEEEEGLPELGAGSAAITLYNTMLFIQKVRVRVGGWPAAGRAVFALSAACSGARPHCCFLCCTLIHLLVFIFLSCLMQTASGIGDIRTARAAASFHGKPYFSSVAVEGEEVMAAEPAAASAGAAAAGAAGPAEGAAIPIQKCTWFCQLRLLFSVTLPRRGLEGAKELQLALVRFYEEVTDGMEMEETVAAGRSAQRAAAAAARGGRAPAGRGRGRGEGPGRGPPQTLAQARQQAASAAAEAQQYAGGGRGRGAQGAPQAAGAAAELATAYAREDVLKAHGCTPLRWESAPARHACARKPGLHLCVVPVDYILRVLYVVPDFPKLQAGAGFENATRFHVCAFKWWRPPHDTRSLKEIMGAARYNDGLLRDCLH